MKAHPNIIPVRAGFPYFGQVPALEGCVFEFSASGPDLRLFFTNITRDELNDVRAGDMYLGYLPFHDLAIIPWRFGSTLRGDAQFHAGMYPPNDGPAPVGERDASPLSVKVILVSSLERMVLVVREVTLSQQLSAMVRSAVVYQVTHPISRQDYEWQVSAYQREFRAGPDAVARAARLYEKI